MFPSPSCCIHAIVYEFVVARGVFIVMLPVPVPVPIVFPTEVPILISPVDGNAYIPLKIVEPVDVLLLVRLIFWM